MRGRRHLSFFLVQFLFLGFYLIEGSWADIYWYIDQDGVIHFTNVPTSNRYSLFLREESPSKSSAIKDNLSTYDWIISAASNKYKIDFGLIKAIIKVESNFNPMAVSRKGAQGLMQLMPDTARELQVRDVFDPVENIDAGTRYIGYLLKFFKGDLSLALAAYNAGKDVVLKFEKKIPPFDETREYVQRVLRYFKIYRENPDYVD
jgi:soluble lytic murein transglycosylase